MSTITMKLVEYINILKLINLDLLRQDPHYIENPEYFEEALAGMISAVENQNIIIEQAPDATIQLSDSNLVKILQLVRGDIGPLV